MNSWDCAEGYDDVLERAGLASFVSLMHRAVGELVSKDSEDRELRRLTLSVDGDERRFYLKRLSGEKTLFLSKYWLMGQKPLSGPMREKVLLDALLAAELPAMRPIAWGEDRRYGLPRAGFLLVAEVVGDEFASLFDQATGPERNALAQSLGEYVGKLHQAGFYQPVRMKDVIRDEDQGRLTLIDRETSKPWSNSVSKNRCVRSLARAYRRTVRDGHQLGAGSISAFLRGYVAHGPNCWDGDRRSALRDINERYRADVAGKS